MPRKKVKKRKNKMDYIAEGKMPEAMENLRIRLSSPRLRAPGTIRTYLETAERFLDALGKKKPTDNDLRLYFINRRQDGISENTLKKEFFHLKKLCQANNWPWPFEKEDIPLPENVAKTEALPILTIETLILAREEYSERERFYLAVSTTYGCRRQELANLDRRYIDDETIIIPTAKHGKKLKHLVPPELKDIFDAFRPRPHQTESITEVFRRICIKAGVERKKGIGWHSIRRTLATYLQNLLAKNNLEIALVADYMGWSRTAAAGFYGGAAMVGEYRRPEILDSDPFGLDKTIYELHPFLPLWRDQKPERKPSKKKVPVPVLTK